MQTYAITAVKHGLECKVKEAAGQEAALRYAQRYHRRTGRAVRVYSPTMERIWAIEPETKEKSMRVEVEKPRLLHPPGLATFTLESVEVVQQPSFNDPQQLVDRWLWKFTSSKRTEDGDPYEVVVWTGQKYGNSQARLTWLLDLIQPGITVREAERLDTDDLLGRQFDGSVKWEQDPKDADKKKATFAYLKPLEGSGTAIDPFAFDDALNLQTCAECGVELVESEVKASNKRWPDTGLLLCAKHGREKLAAGRVAAGAPAAT